jgi:hypothetical protein
VTVRENPLAALVLKQLTGAEPLHYKDEPLPHTVLSFWRWSASNLAGNNLRGHFAEFLVASDIGTTDGCRVEWDGCDLRTPKGLKIEVKSAAYVQSWEQEKHSSISFNIRRSYYWNTDDGGRSEVEGRWSDAYVFCVLHHKDKKTLDPLNLDQWDFYVMPTEALDRECGNQKTISLNALLNLKPKKCAYGKIGATIERVCGR